MIGIIVQFVALMFVAILLYTGLTSSLNRHLSQEIRLSSDDQLRLLTEKKHSRILGD